MRRRLRLRMTFPKSNNSPTSRLLKRLMSRFAISENVVLIGLAMLIGLFGGLGAVAFHHVLEFSHMLFFEVGHEYVDGMFPPMLRTALAPTLGALIAGSLCWLLARHDHSHGTAAVMEAVALHGGRLDERPLITKICSAGVLIGAGGSAGPEDPSVQVGAVIGSSVGKRLRLSVSRVNTLVTAGVASAIAAAFNAPIAGVFFALEIVAAGDFSSALFAPVVLAAVVASIIGRRFLGTEASFLSPEYAIINPLVETPLYLLLGLVAAFVGATFIRSVFLSESLFERLRLPAPLRAGVGGLLVGLIALQFPGVLGVGYEVSETILHGHNPLGIALLVLLVFKFLATAITLGAVRVGGTFAPSMVMGAMVGGLFGQVANAIVPVDIGPPAAYALVGMGAMLTSVVHAPITAVILLFEVTGDYHIILGIMASVVISQIFSPRLHTESIYTERLARRGIQLRLGRDMNILELVTVGEAMTPDFTTVPASTTLTQLDALFAHTGHHGFPVLDHDRRLIGMVTRTDLQRATDSCLPAETTAAQIATRDLVVAYPEQRLSAVLHQFAMADVGRMPVVDPSDPCTLLGVVRRSDIVKAYRRGAMQRAVLEHRHQHMRMSSKGSAEIVEVNILPGSTCDGRMVRDIHMPGGAIITSIRRDDLTIIPRGDTVLHGRDLVTVLAVPEHIEQVERHLLKSSAEAKAGNQPRYFDLVLSRKSPFVGHMVRDVRLSEHYASITSIRRDNATIIPGGDTVLQRGDLLTVLAMPDDIEQVKQLLLRGDGSEDEAAPRYYDLVLQPGAPAVGKCVAALNLPSDVLVVTLRREGHVQAVHGDTMLVEGDEMTVLSSPDDVEDVMRCLTGGATLP